MNIPQDVMDVLEKAEVKDNSLKLIGQLSRPLYVATNKVIEAIGGKWDRKSGSHTFEEPVVDLLDSILMTGEYSRTKQDFGQFDTSPELAAQVAYHADIVKGHLVLEPSAGVGNLVHAALVAGAGKVRCYELDMKRVSKLRERFPDRLGESDRSGLLVDVTAADFLEVDPTNQLFNRIIMNPPFAKQADIDHVTHAIKFLMPNGRLVAIMSASVLFRTNAKTVKFREDIASHASMFKALPAGSFTAAGTNVNTAIMIYDAPA